MSSTLSRMPMVFLSAVLATTLAAQNSDVIAARYQNVLLKDVPHVRQKPDFCGEACVEMVLRKHGKQLDQDYVFDQSGLDPLKGRGCYTRELVVALKRIGFQTGPVWFQVARDQAAAEMNAQFAALHADLRTGIPSIVCMHYDDRPRTTEHFRLVLGYDAATDAVIYHEPAVDRGAYRRMKRDQFLKLWPLKYKAERWTLIRMRLKPDKLPAGRASSNFTDADYAQHIRKLKKKLPSGEFPIVIQKPFVVVGNESLKTVQQRSIRTIKWAVDRIKADYFKKDPHDIIDIWLFKDKASYDKHSRSVFNDRPTTPFGYYSAQHRAIIMNIATGGGTLVHEIVHPFMAANFPSCPAWFNEGLASLYEQCGEKDGHIYGYTNWRLGGLQQAIGQKKVPTFQALCSTTTDQFYNADKGTNYGQARYLCYYLQEQGLLVKYYHQFRRSAKDDPTGYKTLVKVLGERDMASFQKKWEAYVMKLRR